MPARLPLLTVVRALITTGCFLALTSPLVAAPKPKLDWQKGPAVGRLDNQAQIKIPAGYRFLGQADARRMLEAMGNLTDSDTLGLLTPDSGDKFSWFIVFQFDDCGYVKDDGKKDLDAAAMLKSMKEGDIEANKERKRHGLPALKTIGWDQPPNYDEKTHNLQWALLLESEGDQVINHDTRLLGRTGVMKAVLVGDRDEMTAGRKALPPLLAGFSFSSGNTYAEWRPGDKVAKYGLAALITGGAAAVALKTGLLGKLWKILVVGALAVVGGIKKLFGRKQTA